jgi:hypothetical protein
MRIETPETMLNALYTESDYFSHEEHIIRRDDTLRDKQIPSSLR